MQRFYKYLTAALAFIGCAGLVMTGEMNPVMSVSGLALFPGYYRFLSDKPVAGKWTIGTLSLLALGVFFFDAVVVSGDVVVAVAHLTVAFQAIKSFDLKEPWDNLQVFFVSLLQLIVASELTNSVAFGAVFMVFLVLLVTAMVLSHFMKEGYSGLREIWKILFFVSSLTLVVTFFLFIALPRTSGRMFGQNRVRAIKASGFSNSMDFGSFGNIKLDPSVVMRIEVNDALRPPYYWRGTTFDYFDGLAWKNSLVSAFHRRFRSERRDGEYVLSPYDRRDAVEQKVYIEPIDSNVIFGLSQIRGVKTDSFALLTDSASCVYFPGKISRSIQYVAYSTPGDSYPGEADGRYLQLPAGMGRIGALARRVTAGERTSAGKAAALEHYLQRNYTYSLSTSRPPKGMSAIEDFLLNSKKGYCEHYATSMVLMLRFLGIPARIVSGFHGGEKNSYGGYILVRESDAHSWVEGFIDGRWTRFDPTPAVAVASPSSFSLFLDSLKMDWSRYVVGFNSQDQKSILRSFLLPFRLPRVPAPWVRYASPGWAARLLVFLFLLCIAVLFAARTMRFRRYDLITGGYMVLRRSLRRKGILITDATTAGDLRDEAKKRAWKNAEEFLRRYEEARFGKKEMGTEQKVIYRRLLREVRKEK